MLADIETKKGSDTDVDTLPYSLVLSEEVGMACQPVRSTKRTVGLILFLLMYMVGGAAVFVFLEGIQDDAREELRVKLQARKDSFIFEHTCIKGSCANNTYI